MRALLTSILLCLALASCGQRFDTDQRRACRLAIPALNPGDSTIVIEGSGQGPRPGILRIVYRVERAEAQPGAGCGFTRGDGGAARRCGARSRPR